MDASKVEKLKQHMVYMIRALVKEKSRHKQAKAKLAHKIGTLEEVDGTRGAKAMKSSIQVELYIAANPSMLPDNRCGVLSALETVYTNYILIYQLYTAQKASL
ncbi:hypothetical protein VP01_356g3 [Puccinia sorghi]|uniref:Uncharacterized protein n=1 Tax=Puccinia sorghi TaxID=27349 RepID=A0A0L6UX80_9BASI|nr:hypothetical protein VP01_356g3 [Puccinia sorghi]